jgi:hypothetical protein
MYEWLILLQIDEWIIIIKNLTLSGTIAIVLDLWKSDYKEIEKE